MTQAHEVLASMAAVACAGVLGLAAIGVLKAARGDRPTRRPVPPATGLVATGYRYCPRELRTRACIVHTDGTARCLDCGTHIPAQEVPHA